MKLIKLYVDGYKNLIDCEIDLKDFNVLVGPNNSGKSNFLEVFLFLDILLNGSGKEKRALFDKSKLPDGTNPTCLLESFKGKPIHISCQMDVGTDHVFSYSVTVMCSSEANSHDSKPQTGIIEEKIQAKGKHTTGAPITLARRENTHMEAKHENGVCKKYPVSLHNSIFSVLDDLDKNLNDPLDRLLQTFRFIFMFDSYSILTLSPMIMRNRNFAENDRRIYSVDLTSALVSLYKRNPIEFNVFKDTLCQILDLEDAKLVKDIRLTLDGSTIQQSPETPYEFLLKAYGQPFMQYHNFSDGTLVVIAMLVKLFTETRLAFPLSIEEPENGLHPKALKTLISFLKQESDDVQILLTTHSPFVLNNISPKDVIVAKVNEDGSSRLERLKNIKQINKVLNNGFISFGDLLQTEFEVEKDLVF